jgi:hypothetical protein
MASRAEYPHFQRVESNFPANRAETGKFDRNFESSAGNRRIGNPRSLGPNDFGGVACEAWGASPPPGVLPSVPQATAATASPAILVRSSSKGSRPKLSPTARSRLQVVVVLRGEL